MCQVTNIRTISTPVALNKPTLAVPKKEERTTQEYGSYGDYWGCDEFAFPVKTKRSLETSSSSNSLKSVETCVSYGSYFGLDMDEE